MREFKTILLTVVLLGLLITGCSSKGIMSESTGDMAPRAESEFQEEAKVYEEMDMVEDVTSGENQDMDLGGGAPNRNKNQKLIYRANMSVEVIEKLEPLIQSVHSFVENHNGYIETMEQYRNGYDPVTQEDLEWIHMRIRIPHEHYNKALETIAQLGVVVNKSSSVEDVTLQYSDIESTLKMYKIEQDRLLKMLENETIDVKDMIEIEKRLSEVRVELEKQESARRALDSQINYDTIELEMRQVRRTSEEGMTKNFSSRIKSKFRDSIDAVIIFFQELVLILTYMAIPILIVGTVFGIVCFITAKIVKRQKDKVDSKNENDAD